MEQGRHVALIALGQLETRLRELLNVLDDPHSKAETLARAWDACERAMAPLGDLTQVIENAEDAEKRELEGALVTAGELNALARSLAKRTHDQVTEHLWRARQTRANLANLTTPDTSGGQFDRAG